MPTICRRNILLILLLFTISGTVKSQPDSFPVLHGKYAGQQPPGMHAEIFAKGIISTDVYEHSAPAFSPGGNIVLWGTIERGKPGKLWEMNRINNTWTKPFSPSFSSGSYDDMYPFFSVDGKRLLFGSRRPVAEGAPPADIAIWEVEKTTTGWGEPHLLGSTVLHGFEYAHSVARNGNLYFSSRIPGANKAVWGISCSKYVDGRYQPAQKLDTAINNGWYVDGPCISPDESFLIFESDRPGGLGSIDLYICFRQTDGLWGKPVNMGPKVNSSFAERFAGLSPDGKYLFFGSNRASELPDIYWLDARVIKELKNQQKL